MKRIYLYILCIVLGIGVGNIHQVKAQACDFVNDITIGHTSDRNTSFSQMYFLVNNATGLIVQKNAAGATFLGVTPGLYRIVAVNYNPANPPTPDPATVPVGTLYGFVGGCFDEKFYDGNSGTTVRVCGTTLCVGAMIEVGSSKFNAGITQTYVLTNAAGVIQASNTTGNFGACTLAQNGFLIYVVNHDGTTAITNGQNISGLSGCFQRHIVNETLNISDCPALPLELLSFEGKAVDAVNVLNWTTIEEENTQWHVIERAENANHQFSEIGRVSAANTANQNTYVWDDSQPLFSSYYRIRTIDFDGQSHYSHVIHIARANILTLLNVAPVPTQDKVTISFNSPELLPVTLMLTDVSGRILSKEMIQPTDIYNETTLDLTSKASGIYYLLIHDGKTRHVEKLIRE